MTATNWTETDLRAAEARLAEAQAEVDRLRAALGSALEDQERHGVSAEGRSPSAAELGRQEARRRIAMRAGKDPGATDTGTGAQADEAPRDVTAADGAAEAHRRIAARTSAR